MNPPSTTTIDALPNETLEKILNFAAEDDEKNQRGIYPTLCAASLVSRRWSEEARRRLWQIMEISSDLRASLLLSSPALGKYQTHSLVLDEDPRRMALEDVTLASNVILSLRGLRRLEVENLTLSREVFFSSDLSELTYLRLQNVYLTKEAPHQQLDVRLPSFALLHLAIGCDDEVYPQILPLFVHPKLQHLEVLEFDVPAESFGVFFKSIAPHLNSYKGPSLLECTPTAFSNCTHLAHLTAEQQSDVVTLLQNIPSELETLTLDWGAQVDGSILPQIVAFPCLKNLQQLIFPWMMQQEVFLREGNEQAAKLLQARGVKMSFSVGWP